MSTVLYMYIPGLPTYVRLSDNANVIPLPGDRLCIEAETLSCPVSRRMLEATPAYLCFERNGRTERISVAEFLKDCEVIVASREWSFAGGIPACALNVDVEW